MSPSTQRAQGHYRVLVGGGCQSLKGRGGGGSSPDRRRRAAPPGRQAPLEAGEGLTGLSPGAPEGLLTRPVWDL